MTNHATLNARLRRIEARGRQPSPLPCTVIFTESDEDQEQQIASLGAAGTYKPGWPLIAWRISDPAPRTSP